MFIILKLIQIFASIIQLFNLALISLIGMPFVAIYAILEKLILKV